MEHKTAPFNGPGGYGMAGYPFRGGVDALPEGYYKKTAKLCAPLFNKGQYQGGATTGGPTTYHTEDGLTLTAQDDYIMISYGPMNIPIREDEVQEVISALQTLAPTLANADNLGYRPGVGMTVPAGVGPNANDASTAAPDLLPGGGNNARPIGPDNAGGNTGVSAFGQWLSGLRPPLMRGDNGGGMPDMPGN